MENGLSCFGFDLQVSSGMASTAHSIPPIAALRSVENVLSQITSRQIALTDFAGDLRTKAALIRVYGSEQDLSALTNGATETAQIMANRAGHAVLVSVSGIWKESMGRAKARLADLIASAKRVNRWRERFGLPKLELPDLPRLHATEVEHAAADRAQARWRHAVVERNTLIEQARQTPDYQRAANVRRRRVGSLDRSLLRISVEHSELESVRISLAKSADRLRSAVKHGDAPIDAGSDPALMEHRADATIRTSISNNVRSPLQNLDELKRFAGYHRLLVDHLPDRAVRQARLGFDSSIPEPAQMAWKGIDELNFMGPKPPTLG